MKNNMKKAAAFLMALLICISIFPVTAIADEEIQIVTEPAPTPTPTPTPVLMAEEETEEAEKESEPLAAEDMVSAQQESSESADEKPELSDENTEAAENVPEKAPEEAAGETAEEISETGEKEEASEETSQAGEEAETAEETSEVGEATETAEEKSEAGETAEAAEETPESNEPAEQEAADKELSEETEEEPGQLNAAPAQEKSYTINFISDGETAGTVKLLYSEQYCLGDFDLTKPGYHLTAWKSSSTKSSYKLGAKISKQTSKDGATINFTAVWTANTYKIIYEGNTSTSGKVSPLTITYKKGFTLASSGFKKTGYVLKGWSTEPHEASVEYSFDYAPGQKITAAQCAELTESLSHGSEIHLYSVWGPVEYKITYKNLPAGAVNENPAIYNSFREVTFAVPSASGYTFVGWFLDSSCKKPVNSLPEGSSGAKTIYAKLTPIDYELEYNLNGGTLKKSNPATYNISKQITFSSPTRAGYTFAGWYLNDVKTGTLKKGTYYGGNICLEAKWTPFKYNVKYNASGGTITAGIVNPLKAEYDKEYQVLSSEYVSNKPGYSFEGWNTKANCSGQTYSSTFKNLSAANNSTVNLYAMWKYRITVHSRAVGYDSVTIDLYYNQPYAVNALGFSKQGYTFKGWATSEANAAKGTANYANKASIKNLKPGTELWAVWSPNTISISFNKNDGSAKPTVTTKSLKSGANLPSNIFTRSGLVISSWNTQKDGSGVSYAPNELVSNIAVASGKKLTLYAQWSPKWTDPQY